MALSVVCARVTRACERTRSGSSLLLDWFIALNDALMNIFRRRRFGGGMLPEGEFLCHWSSGGTPGHVSLCVNFILAC